MASSVADNLIGGAALGVAFQLLFTEVQTTIQLSRAFKGELENLDRKLKSLEPLIQKLRETNMELNLSLLNTTIFEAEMKKGTLLVAKCKSLSSCIKAYKRPSHTKKLRKLDKCLDELWKILLLQLNVDILKTVGVVRTIVESREKQENMAPARMVRDCEAKTMDLGGPVGVGLQELFTKLKELIKNATPWKETFQCLMAKLEMLQPLEKEITKLSKEMDQRQLETTDFDTLITKATELVDMYPKVSKTKNVFKKSEYTRKLRHLDQSLDEWLKLLQAYQSRDLKELLKLVRQLQE